MPIVALNGVVKMSRMIRRLLTATLAMSLVLIMSGCGSTKFVSPYSSQAPPPTLATKADIAGLLDERASAHPKLWVRADLAVTTPGKKGRDHFTALVLSEEGKFIRLRGTKAPVGAIFDVLLKGDAATLFFNRDGVLFFGTREELRSKLGSAGNIMPEDLLRSVMVQQELRKALASDEVGIVREKDSLLVAHRDETGRQHIYRVRAQDGLVQEWLMRSPTGESLLRVEYLKYNLLDVRGRDEPLPWKFDITVPSNGAKITADVDSYKIDPPFSDKTSAEPEAEKRYEMWRLEME
jgi:hypothetical protein